MYTRKDNTPTPKPVIKGGSLYEVQVGKARPDFRPETRHYGWRFDKAETVLRTRCRAKAERVALLMRTDRKTVRLAAI